MKNHEFQDFLAAARAGDEESAVKLIQLYENYLHKVIRLRLGQQELRRSIDSVDIVQSVMADFFARDGKKPFEVNSPEDLRKLLVTMALNKLISKARHEKRNRGGIESEGEIAASDPTPSGIVATDDLVEAIRGRLTQEERDLFEQNKVLGRTWKEIAVERHAEPDALRMQLTRAIARVKRQLEHESQQ